MSLGRTSSALMSADGIVNTALVLTGVSVGLDVAQPAVSNKTVRAIVTCNLIIVGDALYQPRPPSGLTELLKYGAILSGNIIDDSGEIKGVRCG